MKFPELREQEPGRVTGGSLARARFTLPAARVRRAPRRLEGAWVRVVELVPLDDVLANGGDYLDSEDRERLHASIDRGLEDVRSGRTTDARRVMAALRARAAGR